MGSPSNPFGPRQDLPFADELTRQPQATQSQTQFSGFPQGKLGTAAGIISKFLAGAAEGRMRQAQKIEHDNAQKFSSVARIGQLLDDPKNPLGLTPEARAQKTAAVAKVMAQMVQEQTDGKGKGKGEGADGHPALGFIKNIATRLAGGPLPKKYTGPGDDVLGILNAKPEETISGQASQLEQGIQQKLAPWQKENPGKPVTTDVLQSTGVMDLINKASRAGVQSPGIESLMKTAQDNDARIGRESEERTKLQAQRDILGTGVEHSENTVAPPGSKTADGRDIGGKPAKRITDARGNFLRWDEEAPSASSKPKFRLGATSNPLFGSQLGSLEKDQLGNPINPKGMYIPVYNEEEKVVGAVPANVADSYRLSPDTGDLIRVPKFQAPKAPPPPGQRDQTAAPSTPPPPGTGNVPNPAPPGTPATPAGRTPPPKEVPKSTGPATTAKVAAKHPGLDIAAWDYILDQKLPGGQSGLKWKKQIMARSGQIMDELGIPASQLPSMRADLKANSGALSKLTWQATSLGQFEKTLQNNISYARELNKDYDRTNVRFANRLISATRGEASDPKVTKFIAQMDPIATEWAKVMAGSTSSAGVSVRSKADAQKIIDTHLSAGTTDELFNLIQRDIQNRQSAVTQERQELLDKIKGVTAGPGGTPPPPGQSNVRTRGAATPAPPNAPPSESDAQKLADEYLKSIGHQ
jgi:hypothetical protein